MLNMYKGIPNSPITTITNFINNADTEIVVANATAIPETPNLLVLGGDTDSPETVKLISKDGVNLTVERGFQGTAKNWDIGTKISRNFTEYDYNALVENVGELSTSKVDNSKVLTDVPANAKFTDTIISINDTLTSTSTTQALSANQGKVLDDKIDNLTIDLDAHKADYIHLPYSIADGIDTYTTLINGIASLVEGMSVKIKFTNANTGASTLNINGLGAKAIQKANGSGLSAGNIKAGQICHLVYTGTVFQLLGEGGEYGTAQVQHVLSPYTIGTEEGLKTGTMPNRGAPAKTLTTQGGQYNLPAGYYSGGYVKAQFANLIAENIKKDVNVGGVVGTYKGVYSANGGFLPETESGYQERYVSVGFRPIALYLWTPGSSSVRVGYSDGTLTGGMTVEPAYITSITASGFYAEFSRDVGDIVWIAIGRN